MPSPISSSRYEDLYAPQLGPVNPNKSQQEAAVKNTITGFVEPAHVSDFQFELQRKTFTSFGFAVDPSVQAEGQKVVTNDGEAVEKNKVRGEQI